MPPLQQSRTALRLLMFKHQFVELMKHPDVQKE